MLQRILDPLREAAELVRILFTEPRAFPGALVDAFRRGFRGVWRARGGGLYAVGFLLTFAWLEIRTFTDDFVGASGVGDFVTQQLVEWVLRFTVESMVNTVQALIWPLYLIGYRPPYGMIALAVMYFVFPVTLKKPIERWLFGDQSGEPEAVDVEKENEEKSNQP